MDLLEVKNISKTYGNGEVAVHALKQATFLSQRRICCRRWGVRLREKYASEHGGGPGYAHLRQGVY